VVANADVLYGFVIATGDPQGSSGIPDMGVIDTPAAPIIGTTFGTIPKAS
jgi:hypothetical protein